MYQYFIVTLPPSQLFYNFLCLFYNFFCVSHCNYRGLPRPSFASGRRKQRQHGVWHAVEVKLVLVPYSRHHLQIDSFILHFFISELAELDQSCTTQGLGSFPTLF